MDPQDAVKLTQTLLDGLALGSLYALIALGYTMVYGILKFINFAHSDVFALGSWISYKWVILLGAAFGWVMVGAEAKPPPLWGGLLILILAMTTCGAVGFCIERLAYKPLRRAPRLNVLITAIGVSLFLQNIGQLQFKISDNLSLPFGTRPASMPQMLSNTPMAEIAFGETVAKGDAPANWADRVFTLDREITLKPETRYELKIIRDGKPAERVNVTADAGTYAAGAAIELGYPGFNEPTKTGDRYLLRQDATVLVRPVDVIGAGTAVLLMFLLERLVFHTKLGRAMRAVSFDTRFAALMGVPVDRVISFTFVLGSALAAAGGFLYALKYIGIKQTADAVWVLLGLKAFVAAVVGGIGNVRGAMLGGFFIGLVEVFGKGYIDSSLADVYVFTLLIVVLLVRPGGILGKAVAEKV